MTTAIFNELIKKTSDYDKDERYMATSDIINHLSKDIKIDEILEKKICVAILKQLDDKSNDVQSVAVKCLAILVKKVHSTQIIDICDKLCSLILEGQDALRDIYSIGLKTLISDIPDEAGIMVASRLAPRLMFGISRINNDDITKECLENMNDLIRRFGLLLTKEHDDIMKAIIPQLSHDKQPIKKRAASCLGSLAVVLSDALMNKLVDNLTQQNLKQASSNSSITTTNMDMRTLIQTFGAISRTVGHRLGRHLDKLIPLFLNSCGDPEDENQQTDASNELREYCFPGLESFLLRCSREVAPYLNDVIEVALAFVKYDPNYTYEDVPDEMDQDEEYYADDGDEYAGSDDDDGSWKVRKSAVKVILAAIVTRHDLLPTLYDKCADLLISRFKDREETVRMDVIAALTSLVQTTQYVFGSAERQCILTGSTSPRISTKKQPIEVSANKKQVLSKIISRIPMIIQASKPHFEGSSVKTKCQLFTLFKSLSTLVQADLESHLDLLIGWVENALREKNNQTVKQEALSFLKSIVESMQPSSFQSHLSRLLAISLNATKDDWYKIIADGLRLLSSILLVMRPLTRHDEKEMEIEHDICVDSFSLDPNTALDIYNCVIGRFEAVDIDQEIKECSIIAIGRLFAQMGDMLTPHLPSVLSLLRKRLENEITRVHTLRAIIDLAKSPLNLDISVFIAESVKDLASFLRQQSRSLKLLALQTIDALFQSLSAGTLNMEVALSATIKDLSLIISDSDLALTSGALKLVITMLKKFPESTDMIISELYAKLISMATSSMLQGQTFHSLLDVYKAFAASNHPSLSYAILFDDLYTKNFMTTSKHGTLNLAKCIAAISLNTDSHIQTQTIDHFISDLGNTGNSSVNKQLTLLCLGELGYHAKFEKHLYVKDLIIEAFESELEEVRGAAAYALGHLAMGALDSFLPIVLEALVASNSRHQYLLLSSLREIIVLHVLESRSFEIHLNAVLPGLEKLCNASDDGLRSLVAECLGSLITLHTSIMGPWLNNLLMKNDADKVIKSTSATSLRHAFSRSLNQESNSWQVIDSLTRNFLEIFLTDYDLEVRKSSLQMVNSLIHHNPTIALPYLNEIIIPKLFEALAFKQEKTVDLGPFKHKVDEGLPLRKAALTSIDTILNNFPEKLDISLFLSLGVVLLTDKDEVQLQVHQTIIKIASISPLFLSNAAESLIDPLEKIVSKAPKEGTTGPELERFQEKQKSAVRVISHISKINELTSNAIWQGFIDRLSRSNIILIEVSN